VVAIKGSALTEGHVNLLRRYTEKLSFALDSDMAGDAASRRGIEIADRAGLDMRVVILPSGKDPDEAARENPAALRKAIKEAIPIYDYFLSSAVKRFDASTAFGKKKIGEELAPVLAKIENPIVQGHYVKKVAGEIDAKEEDVRELMRRSGLGNSAAKSVETKENGITQADKLELYVLALLLQGKTTEITPPTDFTSPAIKKIIEHLQIYKKSHPEFLIKNFADSLPKELVPTLDEAFLWDIGELFENDELFAREWTNATRALERVAVKKSVTALIKENASDEKDNELRALTDRLKALEKEG
jgi:DNA primase